MPTLAVVVCDSRLQQLLSSPCRAGNMRIHAPSTTTTIFHVANINIHSRLRVVPSWCPFRQVARGALWWGNSVNAHPRWCGRGFAGIPSSGTVHVLRICFLVCIACQWPRKWDGPPRQDRVTGHSRALPRIRLFQPTCTPEVCSAKKRLSYPEVTTL